MKNNLNWNKLLLELLVVFLGVTAGFVLNSSREKRDDKKLEEKYIQSFIQNIDTNNIRLNEVIAEDTVWLKPVGRILTKYQNDTILNDSVPMLMRSILSTSVISLNYNTYEDIKSSGHLHLIRDYKMKERIVQYHKSIENMEYVDGYYNAFFSDFILPFAMQKFDIFNSQLLNNDKETTRRFFNHVAGYYTMRRQRTDVIQELLSEGEELKVELERYLTGSF